MINSVIVQGNLTRDPEFKQISEKASVCEMSVAVNKFLGNNPDGSKKEITSFVDIKAWGRLAEACAKNLEKGRMILVRGELQQQRWEQDGKNRSKIFVNAAEVVFVGSGRRGKSDPQDRDDRDPDGVRQYGDQQQPEV